MRECIHCTLLGHLRKRAEIMNYSYTLPFYTLHTFNDRKGECSSSSAPPSLKFLSHLFVEIEISIVKLFWSEVVVVWLLPCKKKVNVAVATSWDDPFFISRVSKRFRKGCRGKSHRRALHVFVHFVLHFVYRVYVPYVIYE